VGLRARGPEEQRGVEPHRRGGRVMGRRERVDNYGEDGWEETTTEN
jgi:hypothetical protein